MKKKETRSKKTKARKKKSRTYDTQTRKKINKHAVAAITVLPSAQPQQLLARKIHITTQHRQQQPKLNMFFFLFRFLSVHFIRSKCLSTCSLCIFDVYGFDCDAYAILIFNRNSISNSKAEKEEKNV